MIARPSSVRRALLSVAAPVLLAVVAAPASAQGKGHGNPSGNGQGAEGKAHGGDHGKGHDDKLAPANAGHGAAKDAHGAKANPVAHGQAAHGQAAHGQAAHAKRHVTHDDAVLVSRQVLVEKGYVVSRVERKGNTRVIYYYRGNNGRGKGHGPLMHMVVRPTTAERFAFDGAPKGLVQDMMTRLRARM